MTKTKQHIHEKRDMTFAEWGAFLGVRALLASGMITHSHRQMAEGDKHTFNMAVSCRRNEDCGSVQCIGGAMALILGMDDTSADAYVADHRNQLIGKLFFPPDRYDYSSITPKQAVQAMDNFRARGTPGWERILRPNQREK